MTVTCDLCICVRFYGYDSTCYCVSNYDVSVPIPVSIPVPVAIPVHVLVPMPMPVSMPVPMPIPMPGAKKLDMTYDHDL